MPWDFNKDYNELRISPLKRGYNLQPLKLLVGAALPFLTYIFNMLP